MRNTSWTRGLAKVKTVAQEQMRRLVHGEVVAQKGACQDAAPLSVPQVRLGQIKGLCLFWLEALGAAGAICMLEWGLHWLRTGLRSGRASWDVPGSVI